MSPEGRNPAKGMHLSNNTTTGNKMIKVTTHEGAIFFIAIAHIRSLSEGFNGGTVIVFSNGDVAEVKEAIDLILRLFSSSLALMRGQ